LNVDCLILIHRAFLKCSQTECIRPQLADAVSSIYEQWFE
jgi:hypothetical protein